MIELAGAAARQGGRLFRRGPAGIDLHPTTLSLGEGTHALLGRAEDGVGVALAAMAGALRARGTLQVLGEPPRRVRRSIAYMPADPVLPEALSVERALAVAASIRGDRPKPAREVLAPLGVEALAPRRVASLSLAETRTVVLAEGLASAAVKVLLLFEPLLGIEAPAVIALPRLLAGRQGCVVVATASTETALALASSCALFDRGRLLRVGPTEEVRRWARGTARFRVDVSDPRAVAALLAKDPAVAAVALEPPGLMADGPDRDALARAIARAVVDSEVAVRRIEPQPPPVEELKANVLGHLMGVYQAAVEKARTERVAAEQATTKPPAEAPAHAPRMNGTGGGHA